MNARTPQGECIGAVRLTPEAERVVRRLSSKTGLPIRQIVSEIIIQAEREKMDRLMGQICGDTGDFVPFEQRYEWPPEITYGPKKQKTYRAAPKSDCISSGNLVE